MASNSLRMPQARNELAVLVVVLVVRVARFESDDEGGSRRRGVQLDVKAVV